MNSKKSNKNNMIYRKQNIDERSRIHFKRYQNAGLQELSLVLLKIRTSMASICLPVRASLAGRGFCHGARPARAGDKFVRFLIRTAFWFTLLLLILPLGGGSVSPLQALFAAREAVGDVTAICERKPEVCEVGKSAFETIRIRAGESARVAYEIFSRQFGEPDPSIRTGGI